MPSQLIVNVMLAVVTAETFHAIAEMLSARFKATQLVDWIAGRPAKTLPINVDTRPKAHAVLWSVAVVLTGVAFAVYSALDLSTRTAVIVALVAAAIAYVVTGVGFDRFHVIIAGVGRRIQQRSDRDELRPRS